MRLGLLTWPRVMLFALAVAVWPVWRWYALRILDGSDEPYGLIALATLIVVMMRTGVGLQQDERRVIAAATLILAYAISFQSFSPLPRALVATAALAILILQSGNFVAQGALLGLSLPIVATAQFYVGYPLRLATAETSVVALRAMGFGVIREGTLLHWRGETIMVDAPCSGVRMLWFGLFLAATLAAWTGLNNRRSLILIGAGLLVVLVANFARATLLFFKEAQIIALPDWTHAGVGVLMFAAASLIILRLSTRKELEQCAR